MSKCGAKTKSGKPCGNHARENGRCWRHAGKSLKGLDHPNIKHGLRTDVSKVAVPGGRKSSGLPRRFWDDLVAASEDGSLASMTEEVGILDAREADLLRNVDNGESGATWKELQKLVKEYKRAPKDDKYPILDEIFTTIQTGAMEFQVWEDIYEVIDRKARIVTLENKRLKELNILIPSDRVLLLFRALVEVVMRNVPDPDQQERIRVAVSRLTNLPEVKLASDA